ncbi:acid protease [Roridomyces roridus]|uniref:Acid protease n=1 Tax=Roridomyces roridus TaxID=1738132 RepID=A0AAD7C092_9AGAR|nr:acid protease [Roridomyces roridus]
MFNKATLLYAVTLAVSAAAIPTPTPVTPAPGAAIPLRRRGALTTPEGVFDFDKAVAANVATVNKHRQNLMNLKANKGIEAFPIGAAIKELAALPVDVAERLKSSIKKRQEESLTDEEDDTEWAGSISVGTPDQKFLIDFDTGSSDLWFPNAECSSSTCSPKSKYDADSSSTSDSKSGSFSIQYGDGSTVSGPVFTDTVTVAGITAKTQTFSAVTTLSSSFADDPIDGILGMAYPSISNLNVDPFFVNANKAGSTGANQFGFYLASSGSELYLGGTQSDKYSGDIEFNKIDTSTGFWQTTGASVLVGGKSVGDSFDAIIDSGTTLAYGPPDAVKALYDAIPGSSVYDQDQGLYSLPCDSPPEVSFKWGSSGKEWAISSHNINLGTTSSGSSDCVGAIGGQDLGLGDGVWLLGDAFMKNVYTVFDFDQDAVGFAELA